ncbi:uncharacterized protein V1516DRAFT_627336 [Lipomyces oligophaga]|uniref:uncharacterized protein n=1 Tax=Lipomyces oligophaga TaxID=45792 RepID=UPI0034CD51BE
MEESDFVYKYGPVDVEWITPPESNRLVIRPYALNYFYQGKLHRMRGEHGSAVFELFFDLLYVGIVSTIAEAAIEEATGAAIGRYILLFMPAWLIWTDMRDFMNYYYNNDITQKLYVLWIMVLLVVYANNASSILDSKQQAGLVVGCYILARFSAGTILFVYTFFVKEHRPQMRYFCLFASVGLLIMGFIIIAPLHGKIAIASVCYAYDLVVFSIAYHPWFKKLIGASYSTAVNIEHEVDRHGAFVVIALGEFLYVIVSSTPAATGLNERTARAICILVTAYCLSWFYFRGEGSKKAVHALRRNVTTAYSFVFLHIPLVLSLVLAADASGALVRSHELYPFTESAEATDEETRSDYLHSVEIIYGSCLAIALFCLTAMALCDKSLDPPKSRKIPLSIALGMRVAVAGTVFGMAFSRMKITLYVGLVALLITLQLVFENYAELPRRSSNSESIKNSGNSDTAGIPDGDYEKSNQTSQTSDTNHADRVQPEQIVEEL